MDSFFWLLNFHHSSLKIPCLFGTITHFPSLNIFHIIYGSHTCHPVQLFFFSFSLSSLQYPNSPNLVRKKKKKKKPRTNRISEKKKKEPNSQPRKRKEKKSQKMVKSCGCVLFVGPLCVFNYNIVIEL